MLIDIIVCPKCGGDISVSMNEVKSSFYCKQCHAHYPVKNGIPRFVQTDSYVDSFSWEWDKHPETLVDSLSGGTLAHDMFIERTGLTEKDINGKLCLDAGCGSGRFMEVVKDMGGIPVGVDMSYSVDEAHKILGDNSYLFQADIMNLPFKPESFDVVFSIGVIHHTANTRIAFERLARLVKPGGILAVWVYSNEGLPMKFYNMVTAMYRTFTTRLPRNVLYKLCYVAVPLHFFDKIPVLGLATYLILPRSRNANPKIRILDTFDWYSPTYQFKHTYKEVESWASKLGMTSQRLKTPVSIKCVKKNG